MGLRDVAIPVSLVQVADSGFTVRGLSPEDALALYYRHAGQLSALYDQFVGKVKAGDAVTNEEVFQAGAAMVSGAPQLMAEIIAIASDSVVGGPEWDGDVAIARKLPASVQVDALQKIAGLTFTSDMPPGKLAGLVLAMAQSATAAINSQRAFPSGSGESGAK